MFAHCINDDSIYSVNTGTGAVTLVGLTGYLIPAIRDAESRLPDHDAAPPEPAPGAATAGTVAAATAE